MIEPACVRKIHRKETHRIESNRRKSDKRTPIRVFVYRIRVEERKNGKSDPKENNDVQRSNSVAEVNNGLNHGRRAFQGDETTVLRSVK